MEAETLLIMKSVPSIDSKEALRNDLCLLRLFQVVDSALPIAATMTRCEWSSNQGMLCVFSAGNCIGSGVRFNTYALIKRATLTATWETERALISMSLVKAEKIGEKFV